MQEKILVGHKLRRFRQSAGLSQTAMAEALDISPSYLNLLEHNQRPLTVMLLLKLGNSFDIDMKSFAEDDSPALMPGANDRPCRSVRRPAAFGRAGVAARASGPGDGRAFGGARDAQPVSGLSQGT